MIQFLPLTKAYYSIYFQQCQQLIMPPIFFPKDFNSNLWGVVAVDDKKIVGAWIGQWRGNKPIVGYFVKGVWFDSLPVIFEPNRQDELFNQLISFAKKQAIADGIVTLNVTHWSRQQTDWIFDIEEKNATFIINLKLENEVLWGNVTSKLRNIIRKGEKNNVEVIVALGKEAMSYLPDFQKLRLDTQARAIGKNAQASMLLKSNQFFANLLLQAGSCFFIAKYEDEIVAMALMVQSGQTMYYFSGGSDLEANKKTGASSFLIWKAIEYAKKNGVKFFDMGGVPVTPDDNHPAYGVYFFKKSFGGVYEEYSSGKMIMRKRIYPILNFVLKNRALLRVISKRE